MIEVQYFITKPEEKSNAFNVASDIQSSIKYPKNNFHDFLSVSVSLFSLLSLSLPLSVSLCLCLCLCLSLSLSISISLSLFDPTGEIGVKNVTSISLKSLKGIDPSYIPTKILKLLINDVLSKFTDLFNLSFSNGVFPLILKTSKVIPTY